MEKYLIGLKTAAWIGVMNISNFPLIKDLVFQLRKRKTQFICVKK